MTKTEATKIMGRLATLQYANFSQANIAEEWWKNLFNLDYMVAEDATSLIIQAESRVPSIAEFLNWYYKVVRMNSVKPTHKGIQCWVCMDKGTIFYHEKRFGNMYEFVAYCDRCEYGQSKKYDGAEEKDKNKWYTPAISEIFNCDEIAAKNKEKHEQPFRQPEIKEKIRQYSESIKIV